MVLQNKQHHMWVHVVGYGTLHLLHGNWLMVPLSQRERVTKTIYLTKLTKFQSVLILRLFFFKFRQGLHCVCPSGQSIGSIHQALPATVWRKWREYENCAPPIRNCDRYISRGKDLQVLSWDARHRKGTWIQFYLLIILNNIMTYYWRTWYGVMRRIVPRC